MPIIQTSKIQMRRGAEIELPGAPISLTPLVFPAGLDIGEFGYAVDTGRLWIGHAPNYGQANYKRTSAPYQNVEVLTEASTDALRKIFDFLRRDIGRSGFFTATLVPTDAWKDVAVDNVAGVARPYRFPGEHVIAKVEYFITSDYKEGSEHVTTPIRQGSLRILSDDGNEALIADDNITTRRTDLTSPGAVEAETAYASVDFRAIAANTGGKQYYALQYRSNLENNARIYFDVSRPSSDIGGQY